MKIKKAIKVANNFASKTEKEMSMKEMQAMTTILLDIHKMLREQSKPAKFDFVINEQNPMTLDAFNKMSGAELEINDDHFKSGIEKLNEAVKSMGAKIPEKEGWTKEDNQYIMDAEDAHSRKEFVKSAEELVKRKNIQMMENVEAFNEKKTYSYPAIISQVDLSGLYKFDIKIPAFKGYSRNSVSKNTLIEQAHIDLKAMILNAIEWGELRKPETVNTSKLKSNEELIHIKVKI